MDRQQPSPALKIHSIQALLLVLLAALLVVLCIVMAVRALDPSGVYVFDHEILPDGTVNRGEKSTEIHLLDDDIAVMYFGGRDGEPIKGKWEKSGRKIRLRFDDFPDKKAVYEWDGDYLIGKEDGTVTYYRCQD